MKIKLFGGLLQKAGSVEQEVSGATIREALEHLCENKESLRAAIFEGDALSPHLCVMVNGHDYELAQS